VANPAECRTAIAKLATRLSGPGERRADGLDRSVSAEVTDLELVFNGHLHDGVLDEITTGAGEAAQIRLVLTSDDLVSLAAGELSLGSAWLSGRVKVHASLTDLLRLRSML
jgi:alkyl sulfatase BDS1-like metallo-beta-lactamase superfamily hydrolase